MPKCQMGLSFDRAFNNTMLAATDPDNPNHDPDIIFSIMPSHGILSMTTFNQSQLWEKNVYFVHDNSIYEPTFQVSITRGGVTVGPQKTYVDFDVAPILGNNSLNICQGKTIPITSQELSATDPGIFLSSELTFIPTYLQHGHFERTTAPRIKVDTFKQKEIENATLRFIHDGTANPPSYAIAVSDGRITTALRYAGINFNYSPVLRFNNMMINQNQTVKVDSTMLSATDLDDPADKLIFNMTDVEHGVFTVDGKNITQFNQSVISNGQLFFTAEEKYSEKPSYSVSVSDGCSQTLPQPAIIKFHRAPSIRSKTLIFTEGQPFILTSNNLAADSDPETPPGSLEFDISDLNNDAYFEEVNSGKRTLKFLQQDIVSDGIRFVPIGCCPSFNVSVIDNYWGGLVAGPEAALIKPLPFSSNPSDTNNNTIRNAIIGGSVSGVIGLGFLVFRLCITRKANRAFEKSSEKYKNSTEKKQEDFQRNTLKPIADAIRNSIKVTGCLGYISQESTDSFMGAVRAILINLEKENMEIDLEKLSKLEQAELLSEIAKQARRKTVGSRDGCCSWMNSFFKAEVTPEQLAGKAPQIAKAVKSALASRRDSNSIALPILQSENNNGAEDSNDVMEANDSGFSAPASGEEKSFNNIMYRRLSK